MNAILAPIFAISLVLLMMTGCQSNRIGFEEARAMFQERGVQPGEPLPPLSLVDLNGEPIDIVSVQNGRPMVLVTASLTCNVARHEQSDVDDLRARYHHTVPVIVIYTIDAHPKGDVCPYIGEEWVPKDNEADNVLVPQPTTLEERLTLARAYRDRFTDDALILVDTIDNASWHALGEAPNLGLLIDEHGIVTLRQGWFEYEEMVEAVEGEVEE